MLVYDLHVIGNTLLLYRKKLGMTQAEVAEKAGISDRAYADFERGTVKMRTDTFLRICDVLRITPNDVLTQREGIKPLYWDELFGKLEKCSEKDRETAFKLLSVFLESLN